ncbi:MAG: hypothetical protein U5R06_03980 [candidate division KSB1 bacterium]|nr:hypothetical protein [candidate division KSB1 bacterium]
MEAIKIRRRISSKNLRINELEKLMGQEAEIIILPVEERKKTAVKKILKYAGSIKSGENPDIFQKRVRKEWESRK